MHVKQVIVVRKDLNMRKGKMIAQGAHASMKVFFDRIIEKPTPVQLGDLATQVLPTTITIQLHGFEPRWVFGLFTKVVVGCGSEAELLDLKAKAEEVGLACAAVQDAGLTEFGGVPTWTALAIGPDDASRIDPITGHLPLL